MDAMENPIAAGEALGTMRQYIAEGGVALPLLVGDGVLLTEVLVFDDYVRHFNLWNRR
jgi:hypothetical protein